MKPTDHFDVYLIVKKKVEGRRLKVTPSPNQSTDFAIDFDIKNTFLFSKFFTFKARKAEK